jgi:hypothetical protein
MKGFLPYPRSSFNPKQNKNKRSTQTIIIKMLKDKDKDKPKNSKANGIILKQKQYD